MSGIAVTPEAFASFKSLYYFGNYSKFVVEINQSTFKISFCYSSRFFFYMEKIFWVGTKLIALWNNKERTPNVKSFDSAKNIRCEFISKFFIIKKSFSNL
jgi:hypothetical protein